jgi:hypothetical protein
VTAIIFLGPINLLIVVLALIAVLALGIIMASIHAII